MEQPGKLTLANGRYQLLEVIGEGGMARVWRARDTKLQLEVAIKIVVGDERAIGVRRGRLLNEARAMMKTRHPGIVQVYEVVDEVERPYIIMEYVDGGSLQQRLDAARGAGLPPRQVCAWMIEVLGALAAAHAGGVVHRDVKPSNVLLDRFGHAKIADFGIALLFHLDRTTRTQVAMGSMMFMAPEQRLDARGVGPAADLYAVGSTTYALLTGATPVDLFAAAEHSPRWEAVPQVLREVLVRATRQAPEDRYPTATDMAAALHEAAEQLPPDPLVPLLPNPEPPPPDPGTLGTIEPRTLDAAAAHPAGWGWLVVAAVVGVSVLVGAGFGAWRASLDVAPGPVELPPEVVATPPPSPASEVAPVEVAGTSGPVQPPEEPAVVAQRVRAALPERPPPTADAAAGPHGGTWVGHLGQVDATLALGGAPEAVVGTLVTGADQSEARFPVVGHLDPDTRKLVLRVAPDSASERRLTFALSADGRRLDGEASSHGGAELSAAVLHRRP